MFIELSKPQVWNVDPTTVNHLVIIVIVFKSFRLLSVFLPPGPGWCLRD